MNALVAARKKLPNLKGVFIGDTDDEECMISNINQSNLSPVLEAYPNLEVLKVRATCRLYQNPLYLQEELAFAPLRHNKLKALIVESGGLGCQVVHQICRLELPALEYLELWLGKDEYGGTSSINDLMPILSGGLFPKLKYLGLRNSEYSDDIAFAIAQSPVIEQIVELDLSMGTLGDEGATALLNCPAVNQLDTLSLDYNFLSDAMIGRLSELDCQVIADGQKGEYYEEADQLRRYCSVAE